MRVHNQSVRRPQPKRAGAKAVSHTRGHRVNRVLHSIAQLASPTEEQQQVTVEYRKDQAEVTHVEVEAVAE